ncbi:MAG: hypothetical protein MH472_06845 [Bacteroidia bacterium]|nr:hypothetical protein [Bacteroidia bacterium]
MSWIDNIKNKIGSWLLNRQVKQKKGMLEIPSFTNVHEIGIIYNATESMQEEHINGIAHFLREQGKKVHTIGFVNAKTLPHNRKFHISSTYFWREQLNAFNIPQEEKVGLFMQHKFDLVLNLYFEPIFPLQAMSTLCKAKFKMGPQIPGSLAFNDSVIDMGSDQNAKSLASQIIHYLNVINQHG